MLSQQFKVCTLKQYTSSAAYVILPQAAVGPVVTPMLPEMSSWNMPSADEIMASDDDSPYEWTDEGLEEMRENIHALWHSGRRAMEYE